LYGCKIIQENGTQMKCYVSHMTFTGTQGSCIWFTHVALLDNHLHSGKCSMTYQEFSLQFCCTNISLML